MKLTVVRGPDRGKELTIERFPVTIGRMPETADIALQSDDGISRRHCSIDYSDGTLWVEDLGSRNGTYVGDRRVGSKVEIASGAELVIGSSRFRIDETPVTATVEMKADDGEAVDTAEIEYDDDGAADTNSMLRAVDPKSVNIETLLPETSDDQADGPELENTAVMRLDPMELERLRSQLSALRQVSEAIAQKPDLGDVFDVVVDATLGASMANRVAMLLRGEEGELMPVVLRARAGLKKNLTISRTVVQRAVDDRMTIVIRDTETDEKLKSSASLVATATRSALCVPVMVDGQVKAAVYLDATTPMAFLDDEVELVTAIANQAAIALAHSGLREQLQSVCERLRDAKDKNENMLRAFKDWSRTG